MKRGSTGLAVLLPIMLAGSLLAQDNPSTPLASTPNNASISGTVDESGRTKAENPVSDVIRLQLMNYINPGVGAFSDTQYVAHNVVTYPFQLSDQWNLITRTDIPFSDQPSAAPGAEHALGIGDINPQLFLTPRNHGALEVGPGMAFTFPTASANVTGSGSMSMGPAAVAVLNTGHWMIGSRASDEWSVAGWNRKGYNELWIQPFVYYNFRHGWYLVSLPTYTANWKASSKNIWTVPAGGGVGKHWRTGRGGLDVQLQAFSNVDRPAGVSDWQLFIHVMIVQPKKTEF